MHVLLFKSSYLLIKLILIVTSVIAASTRPLEALLLVCLQAKNEEATSSAFGSMAAGYMTGSLKLIFFRKVFA